MQIFFFLALHFIALTDMMSHEMAAFDHKSACWWSKSIIEVFVCLNPKNKKNDSPHYIKDSEVTTLP